MFRFTTAGESHGRGLVAVLEGIPAGLPLSAERVNAELKRRMGGYGRGARMKIEADQIEWLAGDAAAGPAALPMLIAAGNPAGEPGPAGSALGAAPAAPGARLPVPPPAPGPRATRWAAWSR